MLETTIDSGTDLNQESDWQNPCDQIRFSACSSGELYESDPGPIGTGSVWSHTFGGCRALPGHLKNVHAGNPEFERSGSTGLPARI